jgi:hypothetical protein
MLQIWLDVGDANVRFAGQRSVGGSVGERCEKVRARTT